MNALRACLPLSLCLSTALPAQQSPDAPLPRTALVPVHAEQVGAERELWGAGGNFKASFHDGMTFYPHVGADLPHQPLRWHTAEVRVGDRALPLAANRTPVTSDTRVEYRLGPVTERYDLRADGLEQSFVLPMPLGAGDLTIRGALTTPLTLAPREPQHAPLTFRRGGQPLIGYGTATAIDADGARLPLATSSDGEHLTLHVPAAWLANARYPVVVDPVISAGNITAPTGPVGDCDVLHEATSPAGGNGRVWVVYVVEAAAGDRDLLLDRHASGFGSGPTPIFSRISANVSSDNGSLAMSEGSDRAVLFFDELNNTQNRYLGWHVHQVADMTFDPFARFLLPPADTHYWRPDVGGRIDATGTEILITWQAEYGVTQFANTATSSVLVMTMNPALFPGGNPGAAWTLRYEATRDQERPVINQAATEPEWVIAMMENDNTPGDDWDIVFGTADGNGNSHIETVSVDDETDGTVHKQGPRLAGAAGRYLVTYTTAPVAGSGGGAQLPGNVVKAQRVDFPALAPWGFGAAFLPFASKTVATLPGNHAITGGVAFDHVSASHWCIAYRDNHAESLHACKLGYRGAVVEGTLVHSAQTGDSLSVGDVAFRADNREFVVTYGQYGPGGDELRAARVQYDSVALPTVSGPSCGTAAWTGLAALRDQQQIGAQGVTLRMSGAAPDTGVALLVMSLASYSLPLSTVGLGNCDLLVDAITPNNYLGLLIAYVPGSGEAEAMLDLPEYLAPTDLWFQWLYVDPSDPTVLRFFATERLRLPIAR